LEFEITLDKQQRTTRQILKPARLKTSLGEGALKGERAWINILKTKSTKVFLPIENGF